jgi:multiple sugar transport system permease protein
MNADKSMNQPKVRKESKNKIKVDFERTPLKERLKARFLSMYFVKKVAWWLVRYVLLVGIAYIVLFPFFSKITASFMDKYDLIDASVKLIPKNFTVQIYRELWVEQDYVEAFINTFTLSLITAIIQMFICSIIAYGFAKFKFKGSKLLFGLVILTMIIPHRTIGTAMVSTFKGFDIFGIFGFMEGGGIFGYTNDALASIDVFPDSTRELFTSDGINLLNSYWPFILLSLTGLAFKNGLYIFLLRQFFMGVPDELEESAYIDGSGVFRTFFTIILPISIPMMITVFLFAFSWCWTDDFYTGGTMFFVDRNQSPYLLVDFIDKNTPITLQDKTFKAQGLYDSVIKNTAGLMVIAPLVILYLFCQKFLVQGIERSGLTAD